ncbi:leucine-rich repeat protein 1 [Macrosteles quadrilineatus]|uniref:leucine-rich repeat protein 1 n=1 Tax=Macrosteles quadrilineatus TaxID=74068 RepID=UPI0023E0916F|nr:leucine-rich repeat protein 1 [Macrosteles quadrilineatus]
MKIVCTVEIVNRALPSLSLPNKKGVKSSLTIGKSPDGSIFLLHQTNQNVPGNKFKVLNNIQTVFTKFVNEGKSTIRLKEPEYDLAIKCDPVQLKAFLKTLKCCLGGIPSSQLSTIGSCVQSKALKPVKTKMIVSCRDDYPVLEGFPRTLELLVINSANIKTLDSRILRLRNLRVLNLENNFLTTLPEQFGSSLPNLTELCIANNDFGCGRDWRWIVNNKLQKQLRLLDLRRNKISVLPDRIVKLVNLVTLKLDHNSIRTLPNGIDLMRNLRYFSASDNELCYVPRGIFDLKLEDVDLSGNNSFGYCKAKSKPGLNDFMTTPKLFDIAASSVINHKLQYSADTLPLTVIEYLEGVTFCTCGKACFSSQPVSYVTTSCNGSAWKSVTSSHVPYVVAVRYCSSHCYLSNSAMWQK